MSIDEVTMTLGVGNARELTIYRLSDGAVGPSMEIVRRQMEENLARGPRFAAKAAKWLSERHLARGLSCASQQWRHGRDTVGMNDDELAPESQRHTYARIVATVLWGRGLNPASVAGKPFHLGKMIRSWRCVTCQAWAVASCA